MAEDIISLNCERTEVETSDEKFHAKIIDAPSCHSDDEESLMTKSDHQRSGITILTYTLPFGSLIDTHCHLEFIKKRLRRDVSLAECMTLDGEELGDVFGGAIVNFCQPSEWSGGGGDDEVSSLLRDSAENPRVGITIGCHPHFAAQMSEARWGQMERLAACPSPEIPWLRIVAVGECGLDYSWKNNVPEHIQQDVFARQLKLAMKHNLPLVLHIRNAEKEGLKVLESAGVPASYPMHRHCFGGNWQDAKDWMARYPASKIGVTNMITKTRAVDTREMVAKIPLEKLLLETDAPYFLPAHVSGSSRHRSCSFPGHVIHVAIEVAAIKGISVVEVVMANLSNSNEIYNSFLKKRTIGKENAKMRQRHRRYRTQEIGRNDAKRPKL